MVANVWSLVRSRTSIVTFLERNDEPDKDLLELF